MKLFSILCAASLLFSSFLLHLKYKKEQKSKRGREWVNKSNNRNNIHTVKQYIIVFPSSSSPIWQPLFHIFFSLFALVVVSSSVCCSRTFILLWYVCFARMLWVVSMNKSTTYTQRHFQFVNGLVKRTHAQANEYK